MNDSDVDVSKEWVIINRWICRCLIRLFIGYKVSEKICEEYIVKLGILYIMCLALYLIIWGGKFNIRVCFYFGVLYNLV